MMFDIVKALTNENVLHNKIITLDFLHARQIAWYHAIEIAKHKESAMNCMNAYSDASKKAANYREIPSCWGQINMLR